MARPSNNKVNQFFFSLKIVAEKIKISQFFSRNTFPKTLLTCRIGLLNYLLLNFDAIFPYEKSGSMEEIMKIFDKYIDFIKYGIGT